MPRKKPEPTPKMVRCTISLDEAKLALARKALGLKTNADVLRFALDHLFSHFDGHHDEEE
jgi:hypothetical protein